MLIWEQVHFKFDLMQETLYLMVTLLDQYLSQVPIKKNEMQLVGLTALLLASKYEDFWHPRVDISISTCINFFFFFSYFSSLPECDLIWFVVLCKNTGQRVD